MNLRQILSVIAVALSSVVALASSPESKIIPIPTPERPAGASDLVGFAVAPIANVRVGFIGLGMRGYSAVERFLHVPGSQIKAVCDIESDRVEKTQKMLDAAGVKGVASYSGHEDSWKALCENSDVDLVYIVTDWLTHTPMALYAMEHGKHVAIEVPAAMNLEEIWSLIDMAESKRLHCMMLENCIYDFFEINTLNMAQQGLFGEILHVEGSYIHNLDEFWGYYWNNWRMDYNQKHRGDVYPTHGVGPACQLLDMHRGDRMTTLVSMDTKSVNGRGYIERTTGKAPESFANGDHTMTMIRTANGKTLHIQHNVMTPRPYSRMYQLTGTKGFANKYPIEGYAFAPEQISSEVVPDHENLNAHGFITEEQKAALTKRYTHRIVSEVGEVAKKVGGHGGMDYIMDYRLIYCLNNGLPLDMDVYDLAEWCCLIPLSAISIENGSAPVEVPDFTRGAWRKLPAYRHAYID